MIWALGCSDESLGGVWRTYQERFDSSVLIRRDVNNYLNFHGLQSRPRVRLNCAGNRIFYSGIRQNEKAPPVISRAFESGILKPLGGENVQKRKKKDTNGENGHFKRAHNRWLRAPFAENSICISRVSTVPGASVHLSAIKVFTGGLRYEPPRPPRGSSSYSVI